MLINKKKWVVEWGDCDPADIVFYPRYLEWFDACTTALFKSAGMPIEDLFKDFGVIGIPLVDVKARFIVPSTFGDELVAESQVTEFRRSSFVLRHQIFRRDLLAVDGFETRVWTGRNPENPARMESQTLPKKVIELLSNGSGTLKG
jgi:4-hydroxybenzoyl-CoA thioesterase